MKPLMLILLTLGLAFGNAHAQSDKLVLGGDTNDFNDIDSCSSCVVMQAWYSEFSYECPTDANAILRYARILDEQQIDKNWNLSHQSFRRRSRSGNLLAFEFSDISLSPEDLQKTYCLLGLHLVDDHVVDLDNDGISEVIIRQISGACCPSEYRLVTLDKFGGLKILRFPQQYDFSGPELLQENDKTLIALDRFSEGPSNTVLDRKTFIYEFNGKELSILRWSEPPYLQAMKEVHSREFQPGWEEDIDRNLEGSTENDLLGSISSMFKGINIDENLKKVMKFDLNGDSTIEYISCGYWWRWGELSCDISGLTISHRVPQGCKRLGILPTKSNQWHDLVCDYNTILRFDGVEYSAE